MGRCCILNLASDEDENEDVFAGKTFRTFDFSEEQTDELTAFIEEYGGQCVALVNNYFTVTVCCSKYFENRFFFGLQEKFWIQTDF